MTRGIRIGNRAGYPVLKTGSLNLSSISITPSTSYQVIQAPSGSAYNSVTVSAVTSAIDVDIVPQNIKKDVEILGVTGTYVARNYCIEKQIINNTLVSGTTFLDTEGILKLDKYVLSCAYVGAVFANTNLSFVDLIEIGQNSLYGTFRSSNVETFGFDKVNKIDADGLNSAFAYCNSLTSISFPALTSSSSISANSFTDLVLGCTGVIIHFPTNLNPTSGSTIISSLTGYPEFGNTSTILAYDLPATN